MEYGDLRCAHCGRIFGSSLTFMDPREVKVASCRVCPVNRVYAVCARCTDLDGVTSGPCPQCGAKHMWSVSGKVQKT